MEQWRVIHTLRGMTLSNLNQNLNLIVWGKSSRLYVVKYKCEARKFCHSIALSYLQLTNNRALIRRRQRYSISVIVVILLWIRLSPPYGTMLILLWKSVLLQSHWPVSSIITPTVSVSSPDEGPHHYYFSGLPIQLINSSSIAYS